MNLILSKVKYTFLINNVIPAVFLTDCSIRIQVAPDSGYVDLEGYRRYKIKKMIPLGTELDKLLIATFELHEDQIEKLLHGHDNNETPAQPGEFSGC